MTTSGTEIGEGIGRRQVITEVHCYACGHTWMPRTVKTPTVCPRCKRFNWRKEDWEASKARRRKGGKHVSVKKTAHLGPETEKFLKQRKET